MTGYLIAAIVFALALVIGATGIGRPRVIVLLGAVLACTWALALAAGRARDVQGNHVIPLWLVAILVVLLYLIWCGGLWLGLRLRKARAA